MGFIKEYLGNVKTSNKFLVIVFSISSLFLISHKLSSSNSVDSQKSLPSIENEKPVSTPKKAPQKTVANSKVKFLPKKEQEFNLDNCLFDAIQSFKNKANFIDIALVTKGSVAGGKFIVEELMAKQFKSKKYRIYTQNSLKGCIEDMEYDDYSKGNFQPYFDYVIVVYHEREYKLLDIFKGEQICRQYMSARMYDTSKREWIYHKAPDMETHHTSFAEMDNGFAERNRNEILSSLDSLRFPL